MRISVVESAKSESIPSFSGEVNISNIFIDNYKVLINYAKKWVSPDEADDIVQDCFIKLFQIQHSFGKIVSVKNYLYSMVRNKCIDSLKNKKRNIILEKEWCIKQNKNESSCEKIIFEQESLDEIYATMRKLPPRMQEVFRLYYLEGKSYAEIGELLNTQPGTVRNQRNKAIQNIQKLLQKQAQLSDKN